MSITPVTRSAWISKKELAGVRSDFCLTVKRGHTRPVGLAGGLMLIACLAGLTVGVIGLVVVAHLY